MPIPDATAGAAQRFSPDYLTARARFRDATAAFEHGALHVADDLTIDWAWRGPPDADHVVVHTSGIHGVEGFAGAAAQLEILAITDARVAQLHVHALNPYGMHHVRRVNADNVDLNRNFLAEDEAYAGTHAAYREYDGLLNPRSPPGGFDPFWLRCTWAIATRGGGYLRAAVMNGQYDHPLGLFYGGGALQPEPRLLLPFFADRLRGRRVVHVDWHSGLGAYGSRTLGLERDTPPELTARACARAPEIQVWRSAERADGYPVAGSLMGALRRALPAETYLALACEIGTRGNIEVLGALRAENRLHHWGHPTAEHWAKSRLREAFAPRDPAWEAAVLHHAREVHTLAEGLLDVVGHPVVPSRAPPRGSPAPA